MTEYWKSQENWFCKYCKVWVADNPISRQIHENGTRHKAAVEEKLSEIRRKQVHDAKVAKDESHWLKKMEEAALRDYKKKDIKENRDFTAKLYNNEDLPDVDAKYEDIRKSNEIGPRLPGEPEHKQMKFENMLRAKEGVTSDEMIAPIKASTSGTKWHKPAPPKYWYEAKSEDGDIYFWNTNTKESRWDAPPSGYVSIAEQEELFNKKETKANKKAQMIAYQKEKFAKKKEQEELLNSPPEDHKKDKYGSGGWTTVESAPPPKQKIDLGLPAAREDRLKPVIQAQPEKTYTFKEKTVTSLGGVSSEVGAKPVITFRKRKNQSIRQREDD